MMRVNNLIYSILLIYIFSGCQDKGKVESLPITPSKTSFEDYHNRTEVKSLSTKILLKNDTAAYKKLERIYLESGHARDFLFYSIRMAEDCNNAQACFTTYFILRSELEKDINVNKLSIYYLLRAYELGYPNAKFEIAEIFEDKKIPLAKDYWIKIH